MSSPGAQIVGRVAVRVMPDTTGFRALLEAQLRAMRGVQFRVEVVPDLTGFLARVRGAVAAAEAAAGDIEVDLNINTSRLRRLGSRIRDNLLLNNLGDDVDLSGLNDLERIMLGSSLQAARFADALKRANRWGNLIRQDTRNSWKDWIRNHKAVTTTDRVMRRLTVNSNTMRRTWARMGRLYNGVLRPVDKLEDSLRDLGGRFFDRARDSGDDLGKTLRDIGPAARKLFENLRKMQIVWPANHPLDQFREQLRNAAREASSDNNLVWPADGRRAGDDFRDMVKQQAEAAKQASRFRQLMRDTGALTRNISDHIRNFRELNRNPLFRLPNGELFDFPEAPENGAFREFERFEGLRKTMENLRFTTREIGREISFFDRSSLGVNRSWAGIREAAKAAYQNLRGNTDAGKALHDWLGSSRSGMRDLNQRIVRINPERLYNGFVRVGNAVLRVGRVGSKTYVGMHRGISRAAVGLGRAAISSNRLGTVFRGLGRSTSVVGRGIAGIGRGIGGLVRGFGNLIPGLNNSSQGMGHMSRMTKIVIAVLVILPPLLGLIAGLLAGLPSLLMAFGLAAGAVALGIDGIKAAAKTLQPEFDALKASVSATFEQGMTKVFEQLRPMFPMLTKGFNQVATGVIEIADGIADVLVQADKSGQLDRIFENTGKFMAALRPVFADSIAGFLTWSDAGAKMFPLLSGLLQDFTADWKAFASETVKNGDFQRAIEGLAKVVGSLFDIWFDLLGYGLEAMDRMAGPTVDFFEGIVDIFIGLAPLLETVFTVIGTLVGFLGDILRPIGEALAPVFQRLSQMFATEFAPLMASIVPVITKVATAIGEVLGTILDAIAPVLPVVIDWFSQLVDTLGAVLTPILAALQPILETFGYFFTRIWEAIQPLLPVLLQLVQMVLMGMLGAIMLILPYVQQIIEQVMPMIIELLMILSPILLEIFNLLIELMPVFEVIAKVIIGVFGGAMMLIMEIVRWVWPLIRVIIQSTMDVILGIINVVMGILTGDWQRVWDGILRILHGIGMLIVTAIITIMTGILDTVTGIGGFIIDFFAGAGTWLVNAGRAILQGLWDGLLSLWDQVSSWITGIADWIVQNKGPISKDKRLLIPAGRAIMTGLQAGLESGFKGVQSTVHGMANEINRDFTGIGEGWAAGIESGTPQAIAAIESVNDAMRSGALSADMRHQIQSDDFGSIGDKVAGALAGWGVEIDGNGIAKLVNKSNTRKARRG